jgi:hypothetical protein
MSGFSESTAGSLPWARGFFNWFSFARRAGTMTEWPVMRNLLEDYL